MFIKNHIIKIKTDSGIAIYDINEQIKTFIDIAGLSNGFVNVCSRHTTTAITINEYEERLLDDLKTFFTKLVPPNERYLHNDIHLRDCPPDEPENAHSHITAILFGSSESIPVVDQKLSIGQYQSIMFIELDGPRERQINVQLIGE